MELKLPYIENIIIIILILCYKLTKKFHVFIEAIFKASDR